MVTLRENGVELCVCVCVFAVNGVMWSLLSIFSTVYTVLRLQPYYIYTVYIW
jgi:hypothetical protein